jgi:hypothetical protein
VRADAIARAALDPYFLPVRDQLAHALGCQADAVFMVLDFAGGADAHAPSPRWQGRYE